MSNLNTDEINYLHLLKILLREKLIISVIILIVTLISAVYNFYKAETFSSNYQFATANIMSVDRECKNISFSIFS